MSVPKTYGPLFLSLSKDTLKLRSSTLRLRSPSKLICATWEPPGFLRIFARIIIHYSCVCVCVCGRGGRSRKLAKETPCHLVSCFGPPLPWLRRGRNALSVGAGRELNEDCDLERCKLSYKPDPSLERSQPKISMRAELRCKEKKG
jgi:hypothetical protein